MTSKHKKQKTDNFKGVVDFFKSQLCSGEEMTKVKLYKYVSNDVLFSPPRNCLPQYTLINEHLKPTLKTIKDEFSPLYEIDHHTDQSVGGVVAFYGCKFEKKNINLHSKLQNGT